jgi:hypothetical protein
MTHLGPAASEMERRGEPSERGDINREAEQRNREAAHNSELIAERDALDKAIENEKERITSPPRDREDAQERARGAAEPFMEAITTRGRVPDVQSDGLRWWQRAAMRIAEKARSFALALSIKARAYWQQQTRQTPQDRNRDDGGLER